MSVCDLSSAPSVAGQAKQLPYQTCPFQDVLHVPLLVRGFSALPTYASGVILAFVFVCRLEGSLQLFESEQLRL
jgi:hypothetical protein